jgi:hypothetical protein
MGATDEMVEYLGSQGILLGASLETAYERTREKAYRFLTILVAGIGAAFLLLCNTAKNGEDFTNAGLFAFFLSWTVCAALLAYQNLRARFRPFVETSPRVLYKEKQTLPELLRLRLYDYSYICDALSRTVEEDAKSLDKIIVGAIFAILWSLLVSLWVFFT